MIELKGEGFMKITKNSEFLITAEIGAEEMQTYGVTYEKLDYTEPATRKMIACVIGRIRKEILTDFSLKGRTLIEVMPDGKSGCLMIFTVPGGKIRNTLLPLS